MPCLGRPLSAASIGEVDLLHMRATVPADEVHEHEHDEAHLVLVLEGCYLSTATDMPGECPNPALVFNPPATRHRDRFAAVGGRFVSIALPRESWRCYAPGRVAQRKARRLDIDALAHALSIAALIDAPDAASRLDLEAHVDALLLLASRRAREPLRGPPRWLARAKERLASDEPDARLGDIARDCGVHPAQLARAFRAFEGCTPGQFLRRQRLQRVILRWSVDGLGSLTEAAHAAGFYDHAHLVRAMRQEAGITPSQLRHLLRTVGRQAA